MQQRGAHGSGRGVRVAGGACLVFVIAACGGSSDAKETPPNASELLSEVCRQAREAPCGSEAAEQDCLERLGRDRDDAANEGCESELNAYLKCASSRPMECVALDFEPARPQVVPACSDLHGVFSECITGVGPLCALGYGPGTDRVTCSVSCPEFSSTCTGPSQFGPLQCSCATGPHTGLAFQAEDCSRGIVMATGHTCR